MKEKLPSEVEPVRNKFSEGRLSQMEIVEKFKLTGYRVSPSTGSKDLIPFELEQKNKLPGLPSTVKFQRPGKVSRTVFRKSTL